ncbi:leaf rust 10 disease-resistance locus receptor-like protein kinase-like 1.4 protein isoform X2 [Tanacetum coccineum]
MKPRTLSQLPLSLIIVTLSLSVVPRPSSGQHESYKTCAASFTCGTMSGIQYPFSRHEDPANCGYPGFQLDCNSGNRSPSIDINNMTYHVISIDQPSQIVKIIREDVMESICPHDFVNTTINHNLFDYTPDYMNVTFLYGCPSSMSLHGIPFSCDHNGIDKALVLLGEQGPGICNQSVIIPVPVMAIGSAGLVNSSSLDQVLKGGFAVKWKGYNTGCSQCTDSKGRCFYDYDTNQTACACPGPPLSAYTCSMANTSQARSSSKKRSLTIGLPIAGGLLATIGIGSALFFSRQRKIRRASRAVGGIQNKDSVTDASASFPITITSYSSSATTELGQSTYFGTRVFTYSELESATDDFDDSKELGDGGFGTVYYGKLIDGREVAVKRLYQNSFKCVEQFMNEVEILTIRSSSETIPVLNSLLWALRLNIAIQTAEALAYLHESDIIHRDVKTCNILLDNNFCVKVADFGLSRLFPLNATHVSTAPQGTPGYVDPEYYQCYRDTHRSKLDEYLLTRIEVFANEKDMRNDDEGVVENYEGYQNDEA